MIEQGDLQAIVIVTPDDLHYPMTMDALDAGLHVYGNVAGNVDSRCVSIVVDSRVRESDKDSEVIEQARQCMAQGKLEWLQLQVERANRGFGGHTKKYYQVNATGNSPEV